MHRVICVAVVVFVVSSLTYIIFDAGRGYERRAAQREAIDADIAHWVADSKSGEVKFIFLKPDKPEEHMKKAIEAKVAEYRINAETGEKTFIFVPGKVIIPPPETKKDDQSGISLKLDAPPVKKGKE